MNKKILSYVLAFFMLNFCFLISGCGNKEAKVYTITLDANGGNCSITSINVSKDKEVDLPTPTLDDCSFAGWYFDEGVWQNELTKQNESNVSENGTVYALWQVKVSFDTNGGTEMEPVTLNRGANLGDLSTSSKSGYISNGWFYDSDLSQKVWNGDSATKNVTLYAGFSNSGSGLVQKSQYVDNAKVDSSISFRSNESISQQNINEYIEAKNSDDEVISLSLTSNGNVYTIKPLYNYVVGSTYSVTKLKDDIVFVSLDSSSVDPDDNEITFTPKDTAYNNIQMVSVKHIKSSLIYNSINNLYTYSSNDKDNGKEVSTFLVKKGDTTYSVKDIISIGDGDATSDSDGFYKIVSVSSQVASDGTNSYDMYYIEVVEPELEDIYSNFNSLQYGKVKMNSINVSNSAVNSTISSESLENVKNSVADALSNSSEIIELKQNLNDSQLQELNQNMANIQLGAPTISITHPDDYSLKVAIGYSIQIPVKGVCTITVKINYSDTIYLDYSFTTRSTGSNSIDVFDRYYIGANINVGNDFEVGLSAEIEFVGLGDDDKKKEENGGEDGKVQEIDIQSLVKGVLVSAGNQGVSKLKSIITGDKLNTGDSPLKYIEVMRIPLGDIPIPVTNVVTFSFKFDAVVSMGAKAGIYVNLGYSFMEQIHISNGTISDNGDVKASNKFSFTHSQLKSEFNAKLTLKGKVGLRLAIDAKFTIGLVHTNAIASVYASVLMGPYIELDGLAVFSYKYDALQKISSTEIYGGLYLTCGLHFDVKLGVSVGTIDESKSVWTYDYNYFSLGDVRCPIRFTETTKGTQNNPEWVENRSFHLTWGWGLENIDYINLATGIEQDNAYPHWLKFEYSVPENLKNVISCDEDGNIKISDKFIGTTLFFTVHVKAKDTKALVGGKTLEKDLYFVYSDPNTTKDISTVDVQFINGYSCLQGTRSELIYESLVYAGLPVVDPYSSTDATLPTRAGYYLDKNDLWEKYIITDDDNDGVYTSKKVENWDGKFGDTIKGEIAEHYYLKWKQIAIIANVYEPTFDTEGNIQSWNKTANSLSIYSSERLNSLLLNRNDFENLAHTDMTNAGYKFSDTIAKGYSLSSSYNNYFEITSKNTEIFDGIPQGEYILIQLDGYNYDKSIYSYNEKTGDISYSIYDLNKTYQKLMENVSKNGVSLYENYEPIIYTINWYIDGQNSPFRVEKFYKYEYINKVLNLTAPLNVGDSLDNGNYYVESGLNVWTKITGVVSSYDKEITPVTQDENYTIRYNASEYSLQYIDKTTNIVLLAKMLKVGDTVPDLTADDIMLAYADRNIQSVSDISYTKVDSMPSHCLKIYTTFTSILGKINVVFKSLGENVSSYDSKGVVSVDASNNSVYTYSGDYTKISQYDYYNGSYDFVAPTLDAKAVYDETTEIYKKAIAWQLVEKNGIAIQNGEIVYSGHKMRFLQNSVYEPIYATYGKEFTIQFGSIDQFGNAYTYASVSGLYKGKILDEILKLNNIANPTRIDRNNANTYTFDGWGIDTSTYKVGSEVDISGEELTKITFNAKWITKKNIYTYTFDANGGKFDDNSTQKVLSGGYNDNVNYESLIPTKSSDANNFYVFVGWNEVRSDDVGIVDNTFASQNKTYYAVYSAGEVARTLTINAGEINGVNGYADDNKSTITYTNVYDGEVITLYANRFTLKNNDITAKPYYIINSTNDKIIYFSNEDDSSVELKVNGNEVYTVYYNNCETRLFYVQLNAYTNQTVIYDSSSKVYSEGTSSLFGYVHGKLLTQKYGTSIDLPIAYNYDTSKNLIFKGWVSKNGDGSYSEVINKLVVDNDYTLYPYFEIDNDATVSLTFIAEPYYNDNVSRQNLSASGKILGVPHFADGTDEKVVLGKKNNAIGAIETPNLTGCKFVGWRTADSTAILTTLGNVGNFDSNITYYASYELSDSYSVTLNAGNGKFSNGESSKVVSANYGTITSTLETPVCLDTQKVFSYYADENGNKVETISKDATYTAHYAYAISTIKDLQNISNRLGADFVLTKDIELGITDENDKLILQDYTPIGIYDNLGFTGEFNGNGYSITFAFDASNFEYSGIFAKLSGKVFDLISCAVPYFKNDTNCIASGSIAGIIEGSGIIKNCRCARFAGIAGNVISSSNTISIGTIAGINNGNISNVIIDREGLSTPQILTDGTLNFGTAVGINNGTILSVLTTMGQNGISLARSINCNIGGLVGNNSGIIKNCVVGSSSYITYLNGDNYFEDNCIKFGRISAVDSGKIENCYMNSGIGYCIENITLLGKKCEISFQDSNCYCISILDKTENPSSLISYRVYFKGYTGAKTNESTDYYFDDYTDSLKLSSFDNKIIGYNVSNGNNYSSCFEIDSIVKTKMPYYTNLSELDSMYMLYLLSHLW